MFSELVPELRPHALALVNVLGEAGLHPRVTSTRRSHQQQVRLYRNFVAGRSRYPAAPPGSSAHEYGLAFDLITSPYEALADAGATWESWGGVWGGRFNDEIHFELPGAKHKAKQIALTTPEGRGLLADAFDFAAGFIPIVGEVEMFASVLRLFPGFSESEILAVLAEPSRLFF